MPKKPESADAPKKGSILLRYSSLLGYDSKGRARERGWSNDEFDVIDSFHEGFSLLLQEPPFNFSFYGGMDLGNLPDIYLLDSDPKSTSVMEKITIEKPESSLRNEKNPRLWRQLYWASFQNRVLIRIPGEDYPRLLEIDKDSPVLSTTQIHGAQYVDKPPKKPGAVTMFFYNNFGWFKDSIQRYAEKMKLYQMQQSLPLALKKNAETLERSGKLQQEKQRIAEFSNREKQLNNLYEKKKQSQATFKEKIEEARRSGIYKEQIAECAALSDAWLNTGENLSKMAVSSIKQPERTMFREPDIVLDERARAAIGALLTLEFPEEKDAANDHNKNFLEKLHKISTTYAELKEFNKGLKQYNAAIMDDTSTGEDMQTVSFVSKALKAGSRQLRKMLDNGEGISSDFLQICRISWIALHAYEKCSSKFKKRVEEWGFTKDDLFFLRGCSELGLAYVEGKGSQEELLLHADTGYPLTREKIQSRLEKMQMGFAAENFLSKDNSEAKDNAIKIGKQYEKGIDFLENTRKKFGKTPSMQKLADKDLKELGEIFSKKENYTEHFHYDKLLQEHKEFSAKQKKEKIEAIRAERQEEQHRILYGKRTKERILKEQQQKESGPYREKINKLDEILEGSVAFFENLSKRTAPINRPKLFPSMGGEVYTDESRSAVALLLSISEDSEHIISLLDEMQNPNFMEHPISGKKDQHAKCLLRVNKLAEKSIVSDLMLEEKNIAPLYYKAINNGINACQTLLEINDGLSLHFIQTAEATRRLSIALEGKNSQWLRRGMEKLGFTSEQNALARGYGELAREYTRGLKAQRELLMAASLGDNLSPERNAYLLSRIKMGRECEKFLLQLKNETDNEKLQQKEQIIKNLGKNFLKGKNPLEVEAKCIQEEDGMQLLAIGNDTKELAKIIESDQPLEKFLAEKREEHKLKNIKNNDFEDNSINSDFSKMFRDSISSTTISHSK
ncbi:MAG: hypothetical protein Q4B50_01960 [Bacillota bacterium]|nr:hypothetical protein [Bacillota bacterium]